MRYGEPLHGVDPPPTRGLLADIAARRDRARERCHAGIEPSDYARGRVAGMWIAYAVAEGLARVYVSQVRWRLFLAFCAGVFLGYAQHLYWVSLVTR